MLRLREFLAGVFCFAFAGGMLWAFLTERLYEPWAAWRYFEEAVCAAGMLFGTWVAAMAVAGSVNEE